MEISIGQVDELWTLYEILRRKAEENEINTSKFEVIKEVLEILGVKDNDD